MKRAISLLLLTLVSVTGFAANEDEVRDTVNQYLDARAKGDPNLVGSFFAGESVEQFEWLRQQALRADRQSLCKMTLSQVTRILVIRAKYHQFLADIDARTLAGLGIVDQSSTGNIPRDFQISDVTGNTATAMIPDPLYGERPRRLDMVREQEKWRIRINMGADSAYDPMWQQGKKEKGCNAALDMALDLIDRRGKTDLLYPVE